MNIFTTLLIFIASAIGTFFIGMSLITLGIPKVFVLIGVLILCIYLFSSPAEDTSE
jgi:hypothetical protein